MRRAERRGQIISEIAAFEVKKSRNYYYLRSPVRVPGLLYRKLLFPRKAAWGNFSLQLKSLNTLYFRFTLCFLDVESQPFRILFELRGPLSLLGRLPVEMPHLTGGVFVSDVRSPVEENNRNGRYSCAE